MEDIAKKFPFESALVAKYAIVTTILGFVYDSCAQCNVTQYFAYFTPFIIVLSIAIIINVTTYKRRHSKNHSRTEIMPNIILLFGLILNLSHRLFWCVFGIKTSMHFALVVLGAIGCYFKIKSTISKQKVLQCLMENKEDNAKELTTCDYKALIEHAKSKFKPEMKITDKLHDLMEKISLKYPMEMTGCNIGLNLSQPEMKRMDPLQDETYDEVIAHNDDEADKRLETAKSDIDDLYDDNKAQEIFDQIELQIELKQQITEQSLLNSSSEAMEDIAKKFPFESALVAKYAIVTTILGFVYDSCAQCNVTQYFAYFTPFIIVLSIAIIINVTTYKRRHSKNHSRTEIMPNIILLFGLILNLSHRLFWCVFGIKTSMHFALVVLGAIGCYFKIKSTISKQKVLQCLMENKEDNAKELTTCDYKALIEHAKSKFKPEMKITDKLHDLMEKISLKYPMEMTGCNIGLNLSQPEMKRMDPLQDETYDEVIAHNDDDNDRANIIDDEADIRLETAKSHIDDTGVKKKFFMVRTSIF
eukprot:1164895_1